MAAPAGQMEWLTKEDAIARALPGQSIKGQFRGRYKVIGTPYTVEQAAQAQDVTARAAQLSTASQANKGPAGVPASNIGGNGQVTTQSGQNNTVPVSYQQAAAGYTPTGNVGAAASKAIQEAGTVYGMNTPQIPVPSGIGRANPAIADIAKSAIAAGESEKAGLAAQSRKAQGALQTVTEGQFAFQAALDAETKRINQARSSASAMFNNTIGTAEKYSGLAMQRTVDGLAKIDEWGSEIMNSLNFGKAHDMQVAVQSTVEGLTEMERNTAQQYGADSDEFRQFQLAKAKTLGSILSTTQGSYAKLTAEINSNIMKTKADFLTQSDMYASFQQQQEVEIKAAMANADSAFALSASNAIIQTEMLKMTGWEDLANWQIETPVFQYDSMGTVNFLAQLAMGEWQQLTAVQASKDAASAAKSAGKSAGIGSAIGGIGGAIAAAMILCDERTKENVEPISNACDKICTISGYSYNYTFAPADRRAGVMAQEIEKVLPEAVVTGPAGLKFVRLDAVAGLLVASVKELTERVKTLEDKLNA